MLVRDHGHDVLNVDKLTYAASLEALGEVERHPRHRLLQADICDRQAMARAFAEFDPDAVVHLAAESHVDRSIDGPGGLHRDQHRRDLLAARRRAAALAGPARGPAGRVPLRPRLDRRGVRLARSRGAIHRGDPLRPELALFGEQGGGRPSGARLASDLRSAGDRHQLLEQLRPLPVSREADSAHDHQGGGRRGAARLRQGRERPRLDPCRGSRARCPRGAHRGPPGRGLQFRRRQRAAEHRRGPRHLRGRRRGACPSRGARGASA